MKTAVSILDCTLRDGGYINDWNFSNNFIQNYFYEMENYGIEYVETGLRLLKKEKKYGQCAYCNDKFLEKFIIPEKLKPAVMIKADEILGGNIPEAINSLFSQKEFSLVKLVRIAAPFQNGAKCRHIVEILKNKGYSVSLNLTKINLTKENLIEKTVKEINKWDLTDILYFADTYGEFLTEDTIKIINIIRQEYKGKLGFHGHNNKGLALENSLTAINNGVEYIDSTMNGIGRDEGNLSTLEILKNYEKLPI